MPNPAIKTNNNNKSKKKAMLSRTSGSSTRPKDKITVFEEYLDLYTFETKPVTNRFLDMLADKYKNWVVMHEDALIFTEFLEEQYLCTDSFYSWMEKSPNLKRAHKYVLMVLGNRRERGAINKSMDGNFISKTHGHYSEVWVKESNRIAALAKEINTTPNIDVIIDGFRLEKK